MGSMVPISVQVAVERSLRTPNAQPPTSGDHGGERSRRVAIVGSGVSGLVVAYLLHARHEVTVFEARERIGGHIHTVSVPDADGRDHAVDTGFIVFNERNYPLFTDLLRRLDVPSQASDMSFSVRCDRTGLEYNGSTTRQLFVQPSNLLRPSYHRMLLDILRFNRRASRAIEAGMGEETLGSYLARGRFSPRLAEHYLVPMGSALWSMPPGDVLEMPIGFFVRFFDQHGMLTVDDRPEWRVVQGGSSRYRDAITETFAHRIRTGTPVRRVARHPDHVNVDGERFDEVVFACHSDEALAILTDPTPTEQEVLGAIPYRDNEVVLHTDTSVLPRRRRAWGAWNYTIPHEIGDDVRVTYDMNILQNLPGPTTFCVSLNASDHIHPDSILFHTTYRHPQYSVAGFRAQARHDEISGRNRSHYCGAYWGYGFHEDGVRSGVRVAEALGVRF
jgi:predicted NAD/FAD-binding protein